MAEITCAHRDFRVRHRNGIDTFECLACRRSVSVVPDRNNGANTFEVRHLLDKQWLIRERLLERT